jgi:hypothetical protein
MSPPSPNPRRVAAGKRNRKLRRGLTPEGRAKLRQSALAHRPWRFATGPRTAEGKARSAANGRVRQKGELSLRGLHRELAELNGLFGDMVALRRSLHEKQAQDKDESSK